MSERVQLARSGERQPGCSFYKMEGEPNPFNSNSPTKHGDMSMTLCGRAVEQLGSTTNMPIKEMARGVLSCIVGHPLLTNSIVFWENSFYI